MSERQRWLGLPAEERARREAQSVADRERARTGSGEVTDAEHARRQAQAAADRDQALIEDAIQNTVSGGDINFMDKNDW